MSLWTVLLAAGSGTRLAKASGGVKKQFLSVSGRPLYWKALTAFAKSPDVAGVVVVFAPGDLAEAARELAGFLDANHPGLPVLTAAGGARETSEPSAGSIRGTLIVWQPTPNTSSRCWICCIILRISKRQSCKPNSTPMPTSSMPACMARSKAVTRQSKSRFLPDKCTAA